MPISLLVTIELVKFAQAYFITWDADIYSIEKDMPTKVQSNNLIDQLGQINYIFSDKTGTLTQNVMEFRQMSAGVVSYGSMEKPNQGSLISKDSLIKGTKVPNVNF